jgi:hypothetical protein
MIKLVAYSACVGRWSLNSIKPMSQEIDDIIVHDAMCVLIRKVIVEARNELEHVNVNYLFFSISNIK